MKDKVTSKIYTLPTLLLQIDACTVCMLPMVHGIFTSVHAHLTCLWKQEDARLASNGLAPTSGIHMIHEKPYTHHNTTFQVPHRPFDDDAAAILSLLLHIRLPLFNCQHPVQLLLHVPCEGKSWWLLAVTIAVSNSIVIIFKLKLPMAATSFPVSSKPGA